MGNLWFFFIMAVLVLSSGWGSFKLVMLGQWLVFWLLLVMLGGAALYLGLQARGAQGWDAIGFFAFLLVFIAPALVGLVVGGALGLLKRKRAA